jgi:DNA-binding transcriptional regulator YdaS (Cro superfamily)
MQLIPYLSTLRVRAVQEAFATRCGTSLGHMKNVGYGHRSCDPALALSIERETEGLVTRQEMRPQDYWRIWPDLPAPASTEPA